MKNGSLIERRTELSANLVLLSRFLRDKGYTLGVREEAEALQALGQTPLLNKDLVRSALKAVMAKNAFQFAHFDDDFEDFWYQLSQAVDAKIKHAPQKQNPRQAQQRPSLETLKEWLYHKPAEDRLATAAYSAVETFARKEFSAMDQEELHYITQLIRKVKDQQSREKRRLKTRSKAKITADLKSTIRESLRRGGEIMEIRYVRKKEKRYKVVLLCDVSRSMELYSKFFIHLMYAFQNAYDKISTWVFSTAMHRVSDLLDHYEFEKAYQLIAERVPQWSGGTRIGASIDYFNQWSGSWSVDRRTVVFIVSDGWDTGDSDLLASSVARIHQKAKKVIWLNPLAGSDNYSPQVMGLKAALPFVDHHLSCHNLQGLRTALRLITSKSLKSH